MNDINFAKNKNITGNTEEENKRQIAHSQITIRIRQYFELGKGNLEWEHEPQNSSHSLN